MPKEWEASFEFQLQQIISRSPKYVWGGTDDEKGVDCSGYIWLAAQRAAIPGIKRTTALRMAQGFDGWTSVPVLPDELFSNVEECDLPFWSWSGQPGRYRPFGHVGAFLVSNRGLLEVTHASGSAGKVVLVPFRGKLVTDLATIRRLTIGDLR